MNVLNRLVLLSGVVLMFSCNAFAYTPPKGIPDPATYPAGHSFGFEIDIPAPDLTTACPNWYLATPRANTAADGGRDCYYMDNADPAATDTANPYGYPTKPRISPPPSGTHFSAGTIVYFNGGTYNGSITSWHGDGTPANPIWILGNPSNRPVFTRTMMLSYTQTGALSYFILDNLNFFRQAGSSYSTGLSLRPAIAGASIDHVLIRHCGFQGLGQSANLPVTGDIGDGSAIGIGASTTNGAVNYIVVWDVDISSFGYVGALGVGGEETGVYKDYLTDYVWVLNSTIHHVGADSIAGSHTATVDKPTEHFFIGGNTLYGNGENGIDLKSANHVVISENAIYGPFQDEQGWAIVLHYGAASIPCKNVYVLFNRLYHLSGGVVANSAQNTYMVGNVVYDIANSYGAASDPYYGGACLASYAAGDNWFVNNTCYDHEQGIKMGRLLASGDDARIFGNIIAARKETGSYDINIQNSNAVAIAAYLTSDHNLIYPGSGVAGAYNYGGSRDLSQIQAMTPAQCANCSEADPLFINAAAHDFHPRSGSPAIDTALGKQAVYDKLYAEYGVRIEYDMAGTPRPQNLWDIGAYEYDLGYVPAPAPPGRLRLQIVY
jgi:hypothetical protein